MGGLGGWVLKLYVSMPTLQNFHNHVYMSGSRILPLKPHFDFEMAEPE